jgi:hypothetical protein
VCDAARDFAALEFGDGRAYVFAAHDDEAHPHVHLSVQVRGPDGRRLNPRRQDLRRWRERFAEQLREHGVDANATLRRTRGVTKRYPSQGITHMLARDEVPTYWRAVATSEQEETGWKAHDGVFAAWREVARSMAASSVKADRAMAASIVDFVRDMPVQQHAPVPEPRPGTAPTRADRPAPEHDIERGGRDPDIER